MNRVVEWEERGITIEADERHAQLIIRDAGLQEESKGVVTPGVKEERDESEELSAEQSTMYRAIVARANYLAQDRSDIAFSTKELCRKMSQPTEQDWRKMKRLARYLKSQPKVKIVYMRGLDLANHLSLQPPVCMVLPYPVPVKPVVLV